MPRGRCHFALLSTLHAHLRRTSPDTAEFADRHLPDLMAGSVAPDAMRIVGRLGKFSTHFYAEDRKETWGKSVSGMFRHHPDLSDPSLLASADVALLLGYISHLTVDEAFRDAISYQTHVLGSDFRPTVRGLWSMVDGLPIHYENPDASIGAFDRTGGVGFIDCAAVREFLGRSRPWASASDPWEIEKIFLALIQYEGSEEEARSTWEADQERARPLLDDERMARFVSLATEYGCREIETYLDGGYAEV